MCRGMDTRLRADVVMGRLCLVADLAAVHECFEQCLGCVSQPPNGHHSLRHSCDSRQCISTVLAHITARPSQAKVSPRTKSSTPYRKTMSSGYAHGIGSTRARNLCLRFALPCLLSKHTVSVWRSRHCKWPPFRSASDVAVTYLCSRRSTTLWFRISSGGSSADRDGCRWKNLASVESAQGLRRGGAPLLSMTRQREPACRSSHWSSEND